ncbi:MAG: PQQ-binding-like beta-propeller repeat protein [Acidobacteriia bacterium]|nr:PQQ-binding-like beta-propeller repeat protein [Terriglobia bacterium]
MQSPATLRGAMCIAGAFLSFVLLPLTSAEWNQWLGPNRDGKSSETGLLAVWPESGPKQVWQVESLGAGYSSLAVNSGTLFTQGVKNGKQFLIALDAETGETVWETEHGKPYSNRRGGGPRGTPTVDDGRVYALGGDGNLICADATTGAKIWEKHLLKTYGARNINWGISESPLIDGNRIIVNAGGRGASIVALDKATGKELWKTQSDEAGYSSGVAVEIDGVRQYLFFTGEAAVGVLASNGELLWRYMPVSNSTANVATPIVRDNLVFFSSSYGTGCALLRLESTGGSTTASEVYFNRDMRNHYSSSVLIDDHLYGFSGRILTAMEFETGELAWRDRSVGKGQMIYADGRFYILSDDGVVGLVEPDPSEYREVSRFEIGSRDYPTWTLPVISDGKLYLRDQERLYAYSIKAP